MRLKPEQRLILGELARTNTPKNLLMLSFSVSRKTVWYWGKQNLHCVSDLPRANHKFKITLETEITIIAFRNNFGYGTARIQQRLFCAPSFELEQMEVKVQGIELSRQAILNDTHEMWCHCKILEKGSDHQVYQVQIGDGRGKRQLHYHDLNQLIVIKNHPHYPRPELDRQ